MKILCAPSNFDFSLAESDVDIILYGRTDRQGYGSAGAAIRETISRNKLNPDPRAFDFLSFALAVTAADLAGHRDKSPNGWTREFNLQIAVADRAFWETQKRVLEQILNFLTTDIWKLHFCEGGLTPDAIEDPIYPEEDCAVLLSGGLDSFVGTLDLVPTGERPFAVSQSVRGDAEKQRELASVIDDGLRHLQFNHNVVLPDPEPHPSQRARSIIFFAYGILVSTTLARYQSGESVKLYVCENGFIAINPPMTDNRLGSLSTRTCNPVLLALLQQVLDAAGLRVRIESPYRFKTKGEMLLNCREQDLLLNYAHRTTSCGRFNRFGNRHCGRCIPCLIRRAAFQAWGVEDMTDYVYSDLSINDNKHARFDDVRSVAMAIASVAEVGLDRWLGATLVSPLIKDSENIKGVALRGLSELEALLNTFNIE